MIFQDINPIVEDNQVVQAARKDPRAFGELYNRYVERVYKYLYSRLGNTPDAEDLTSQTFLAAFEAFERFTKDGCFAAWLFTIARNKTTDFYRRKRTVPLSNQIPEIQDLVDPLNNIIQTEQSDVLRKLILGLDEDEQELLRLRFLAGLSYPEMASLLDRKEDAVKKTLYRLLERLHNQMEVSNE